MNMFTSFGPAAQARVPQPGGHPPRISLALQGGGAFGAFTWGVLDRLLEAQALDFDTISGASAGAVNAVLLASGLANGGREAAREVLARFWTRVSEQTSNGLLGGLAESRATMAFDISSRFVSPYQFNPLGLNPLRAILADHVDFAVLEDSPVRLLVGATRVSDGTLRVFRDREVTMEAVLASTCLPLMHHAVEIEGDMYWDGGYAANPPLLPLVEASETSAILLVQIVPSEGDGRPRTSPEIVKRLNQMTFHQPLAHDIEAIRAMKRMVAGDTPMTGSARKLAELSLECLAAEDWVPDLKSHSTLDLDSRFVTKLHQAGRDAASDWLEGRPD